MDRFTQQEIEIIEEQLKEDRPCDEQDSSGYGEEGVKYENE